MASDAPLMTGSPRLLRNGPATDDGMPVKMKITSAPRNSQVHKSVRVGIDAAMDLDDVDKLRRPEIPGAGKLRLEDYR